MRETNRAGQGQQFGKQYGLTIGIVKNNADPAEHGRLQIFLPSIDAEDFNVADLPWAVYVSPFGGVTANPIVGREGQKVQGLTSYGMWAIPKNGAEVLVGFLDGNPEMRFWLGCVFMPEYNRTLPGLIDGLNTELDDSGLYPSKEVTHVAENLKDAGLYKGSKHFETRGGYERSISHPSNKNKNKPRDNGYATNPLDSKIADSQTYVPMRTPGGHHMLMSDVDEHCRIRIKTTAGSQLIFDDTNERIYLSTAKGRNWVELDETNGRVYVYSDSKINIRGKNDINIYSDENVNIVAKKRLNLVSEERSVIVQANLGVGILASQGDVKVAASRDINLVTFNGPKGAASGAEELAQTPAWHQQAPVGKGYIYRWAESGGSSSSSIKITSAQTLEASAIGAVAITSAQTVDIAGGAAVKLGASTIHHAAGNVTWSVGDTGLNDGDPEGPFQVQPNGGAESPRLAVRESAQAAINVSEKMIRPDHESWTRDEDEGKAATPRGPKYKG